MAQTLSVEALIVRAESGRILLDIPYLSLEPGMAMGIRGPSGAGKSTFLYALAGLVEGARGRVLWNEWDICAGSPRQRAVFRNANIGMIFQDFLLFEELGAVENASLSALFRPRKERRALQQRARDHLGRLGIDQTPRNVVSFSGGERQRVAVARALAADPTILLADEPTASLHREAADALIADLVALVKEGGKTLVAVSHDAAFLSQMDKVMDIADGRIVGAQPAAATSATERWSHA